MMNLLRFTANYCHDYTNIYPYKDHENERHRYTNDDDCQRGCYYSCCYLGCEDYNNKRNSKFFTIIIARIPM